MGDWFVSKPSKGHRVEEVTIDDVVRVKSLDRSIDWACVVNVTTGVDALKINGRYFESAAGQSKIKSIFCAQPEMLMRHLRGRSGDVTGQLDVQMSFMTGFICWCKYRRFFP